MCGGTVLPVQSDTEHEGLSPRVRGNPPTIAIPKVIVRSIPACAGEPEDCLGISHRQRVYPRVCGGTPSVEVAALHTSGLSPRVRGNLPPIPLRSGLVGSIPACAGEPVTNEGWQTTVRVYPRVCGGTAPRHDLHGAGRGLSPRVRGNPFLYMKHLIDSGSIPACAGEPPFCGSGTICRKVYPRVCGGTVIERAHQDTMIGLSPRVRGNP